MKDSSNIASFYGLHIDGIICEKQIGLGLAKKYWNFMKISSDCYFTVKTWFLENVHVNPYFNTQWRGCKCVPNFWQKKKQNIFHRKTMYDYLHPQFFRPSAGTSDDQVFASYCCSLYLHCTV